MCYTAMLRTFSWQACRVLVISIIHLLLKSSWISTYRRVIYINRTLFQFFMLIAVMGPDHIQGFLWVS